MSMDMPFLKEHYYVIDCHFFRTSWQFHNLGQVEHVLRMRWSPFINKFSKLIILGYAFCNYWGGGGGWGPIIGTADHDIANRAC